MDIVLYPADELRHTCKRVDVFDSSLREKCISMLTVLKETSDGVGLAAPQVGFDDRVIVVDMASEGLGLVGMINPEIVSSEGSQLSSEGCLSLPGVRLNVPRASSVNVRFQDWDGTAEEMSVSGFSAAIIQHEIDHLDGKLIIDRVSRHDRRAAESVLRKKVVRK